MEIKTNELTLKKLRLINEIDQKKIASLLEMTAGAYSKKELGQRKFDIDEFKKLCEIFKLSMEDMYIIIKNK